MSELDNLMQDIEKFKKNVAASNDLCEKLNKATKSMDVLSDNDRVIQDDIKDLSEKIDHKNKDTAKQLDALEQKISEMEKKIKNTSFLSLTLGCCGAIFGLIGIVLLIVLLGR